MNVLKLQTLSQMSLLLVTSEKTGTPRPSFRSFYCANVWKLWTVFFLWYFGFD